MPQNAGRPFSCTKNDCSGCERQILSDSSCPHLCIGMVGKREGDGIKSGELWKSQKSPAKILRDFSVWTHDVLSNYVHCGDSWKYSVLFYSSRPPQLFIICSKFTGVCYFSFKWERLFTFWKSSFSVPKEMCLAAFPSPWILLLPLHTASCTFVFGEQSLICCWGDSLHAKSLKHKHTSGTDSPQCASKCGNQHSICALINWSIAGKLNEHSLKWRLWKHTLLSAVIPQLPSSLCLRAVELKGAQAGDFENAVQEFVTLSCKILFRWLLWWLRSPVFIQLGYYSAFAVLLKVCCILPYKLYIIIRDAF